MEKYLGVKLIEAQPVTAKMASMLLERPIDTTNADAKGSGYLVKYPDGYRSWSPKSAFEEAYRKIDGLTFGLAIEAMKKGYRVARSGWNGKGMWLRLVIPGGDNKVPDLDMENLPYIEMKTSDNKLVPWLASQTDMLAEDYSIIE